MDFQRWGTHIEDLKYAWRLCRMARSYGKYRPAGSFELKSDTDTGFLYRKNGVVFIVIDGSNNLKEWIKNFMWFRIGSQKEAAGFFLTGLQFAKQVESLLYSGERVVGVGHSRGGAVIQSACLELKIRGINIQSVISFGSPKVGGLRFCKYCKLQEIYHIRVFAPKDIVPKLPRFRGLHFSSQEVTFDEHHSIFDFGVYKVIRGIIEHLSYGGFLNSGKILWK